MNQFKKGDTVRLKRDPKSIEKVGRVDDERVYVCFGFFTIAYRPEDLELVKPADLTNDAPRRRTEPAITVPTDEALDRFFERMYASLGNAIMGYGLPKYTLYPPAVEAFTPTEVEACRSFGAAAYACMAADVEQCRELLAVEEAKAAMERDRLELAEWLGWMTDGDALGYLARQGVEYREQFVDRWEAWLASLTPPSEGATMGDWAAAQPTPPTKWSREYMQHLYDKLAKGEVVGG